MIYFENLCIESIKEGTGEAGFLSEIEQTKLYYTFNEESERRLFNQFNRAYRKITTALDKLRIQQLTLQVSAESYFWITVCELTQSSIIEIINETLFDNQKGYEIDDKLPKEAIERIFFGTLYKCGGFFEIEPKKGLNFLEILPLLKCATIDKLVKVKSSIHAIERYMNELGFNVKTYEQLIRETETETIRLCSNISTDYSEIQVDKIYSDWFRDYFLK